MIFKANRSCWRLCNAETKQQPFEMTKSLLLVFDFDHSIIDANSDHYVTKLVPPIPAEIKESYNSQCWVYYMGAVFEHLHKVGITPEQILKCMNEIPFISGMKDLLQFMNRDNVELIIISDANSVFIKQILQNAALDDLFAATFTNPAEFDSSGCLRVQCYHYQDWCPLSTTNLCKGSILQDYLKQRQKGGVTFSHIAYVGDGTYDLCPCLTLSANDFVFPRTDFSLWKKIKHMQKNKDSSLKAKVVPWNTGLDILETVKPIVS